MSYSHYYVRLITDYKVNHLLSAEVNLYRPKFVLLKVVLFASCLVGIVALAVVASLALAGRIDTCARGELLSLVFFWGSLGFCSASARICMLLILLYQRYAAASTRLRCRCVPSCSQYAYIAFRKYGFPYGLYKTILHLKLCERGAYYEFP